MATVHESITLEECNEILAVLNGLPVTHVWLGYASSLFLEIGKLKREERQRADGSRLVSVVGQATFMLEPDWRVEGPRSIRFGSGFGERKIANRVTTLKGIRLATTVADGAVPELTITLSDGRRIRTFTNRKAQPCWSVGFKDIALLDLAEWWDSVDVSPWVGVHSGRLSIEYCFDPETLPPDHPLLSD